jgi:PLAT/LH2 domain
LTGALTVGNNAVEGMHVVTGEPGRSWRQRPAVIVAMMALVAAGLGGCDSTSGGGGPGGAILAVPLASEKYRVTVKTADVGDAGTDAKVTITLFGPGCVIGSGTLHGDFDQGSVDVDTVLGANLPTDHVTAIKIGQNDTGDAPGWRLQSVGVTNLRSDYHTTFEFQRWLASDEGDLATYVYNNGETITAWDPSIAKGLKSCGDASRQAPAATPDQTIDNDVWSGHAITAVTTAPNEQPYFRHVLGTWEQPEIDCTSPGSVSFNYRPMVSVWVGFDGATQVFPESQTVEQTGVTASCNLGSPGQVNQPWWEEYPGALMTDWQESGPGKSSAIRVGDLITATVDTAGARANGIIDGHTAYCAGLVYRIIVAPKDASTGNHTYEHRSDSQCLIAGPTGNQPIYLRSAEWIVERDNGDQEQDHGGVKGRTPLARATNGSAQAFLRWIVTEASSLITQPHAVTTVKGGLNNPDWIAYRFRVSGHQGADLNDPACANPVLMLTPTLRVPTITAGDVGDFTIANLAGPYCPIPNGS